MTMSDRELLEFAAKAAGKTGEYRREHQAHGDLWVQGIDTGARFWWNPLEDDGDCLRMALDLNLQVRFSYTSQIGQNTREEANKIRCESYRRAAVEMAAEIGKAMQEQTK